MGPFLLATLLTAILYFVVSWERASTREIHITSGASMTLANLTTVDINGQLHFMTIRTAADAESVNKNNVPVLLILHGGPGATDIPFLYEADYLLEEHFIVVHYDQRSAGKSCRYYNWKGGSNLTLQQHVDDGVAIVENLRGKFQQDKIYIAGGSWGSMLALTMAHQHPELFHFVAVHGTLVDGLSNDLISREFILSKFPHANVPMPPHGDRVKDINRHTRWLVRANGAFYQNPLEGLAQYIPSVAQWALHFTYTRHLLASPEYSYGDTLRFQFCHHQTTKQMALEVQNFNAYQRAKEINVPVLFLHGRQDHLCVVELVEDYYQALQAPWKRFVWFEQSGHFPDREEARLFQETLISIFFGNNQQNMQGMDDKDTQGDQERTKDVHSEL